MKGPVETKVAASTGIGGLVALIFELAAVYHWFTPPPPQATALIVAAVSGLAGWLAPHTSRPPGEISLSARQRRKLAKEKAEALALARVNKPAVPPYIPGGKP